MTKAAVYTRTGDKGTTGLYTGQRVAKQSQRVEAYGSVDEINSALGLARALVEREDVRATILQVQKLLMSMMADVASLEQGLQAAAWGCRWVGTTLYGYTEATAGQQERFDLMASLPQHRFPGGVALRWPLLVTAMTWFSLRDRLGI